MSRSLLRGKHHGNFIDFAVGLLLNERASASLGEIHGVDHLASGLSVSIHHIVSGSHVTIFKHALVGTVAHQKVVICALLASINEAAGVV